MCMNMCVSPIICIPSIFFNLRHVCVCVCIMCMYCGLPTIMSNLYQHDIMFSAMVVLHLFMAM